MKQFLVRDLITYSIVLVAIVVALGGLFYFDSQTDDFERFVSELYSFLID